LYPEFSIATARFCAATSRWIFSVQIVPSVNVPMEIFNPTASFVTESPALR
jgi:hypothetical protein